MEDNRRDGDSVSVLPPSPQRCCSVFFTESGLFRNAPSDFFCFLGSSSVSFLFSASQLIQLELGRFGILCCCYG
ncbi:hypothetical protein LINPERPRIM_LOCUS17740 [Linum perenne]